MDNDTTELRERLLAVQAEAAKAITHADYAAAGEKAVRLIPDLLAALSAPVVAGGDGMVMANRETLADLVVREACETDPADPDDPDTILIRTHDLRWAALAAMSAATSAPAQQAMTEGLHMPPLNDELRDILGRPCFTVMGIASLLRKFGHVIPAKAEAEQASAIYFMLTLYAKHGDAWRSLSEEDIRDQAKALAHAQFAQEPSNG